MDTVDLFAGCGGMSLGFSKAGFDVQAAVDWWDPAIEVYRKNITAHPIFKSDLSDVKCAVELVRPFKPRVIIGGPPCQDFSQAGKRNEGNRANLTVAYATIISQILPTWFVMENVDRARHSAAFHEAEMIFTSAGYGLTTVVLDASLCGVPQKRKRMFCIGRLNESDDFLLPTINARLSTRPTSIRDYFGNDFGIEHYYRHPRNYSRRGIFSIDEPAPTVRGVNRPVPPGYKRHEGDRAEPHAVRCLSTEERAMLQTFPKDFVWIGTKTNREQMIGNAVPVDLAYFVASCVKSYEALVSPPAINNEQRFYQWLIETEGLASRSAKDVVSRARRAASLLDVSSVAPNELSETLFKISMHPFYSSLSPSVRSQIKRALSLYVNFQKIEV